MDRTTPKIRPTRIALLAAVALLIAFAAAPALPAVLRADAPALARLAAPALAESGDDDDEADVTGGASVEASPTPTPSPEPTLPPGVTATPTPSPAPRGAGWPFANWAVVGIYALVGLASLPLLFRRRVPR